MIDQLLDFVVEAVRKDEQSKFKEERKRFEQTDPVSPSMFWTVKKAGDLVGPSKTKAEHHRGRETFYIAELEEAEKELKEKGVSVDVFDTDLQAYVGDALVSGNIRNTLGRDQQNFQARIDQKLLDNVKTKKAKMLDHRDKAKSYERYANAFACDPLKEIRLGLTDIEFFGL